MALKKINKIFPLIAFLFGLFVIGFFSIKFTYLKQLGIQKIPDFFLDEFDFVWIGKSFIKTGIPTGWSDFGAYRDAKNNFSHGNINGFVMTKNNETISLSNFKKFHFPIISINAIDWGTGKAYLNLVTPYFDHPLLTPLIFGLAKTGGEDLESVKVEEFRQVSVILSLITGILIYFCAYQLAGFPAGLLAFFVYSTVPTFVFVSRLSLAENLIVPFSLITLNFLLLFNSLKKKWLLLIGGLFAGFAGLAKIPGLFMVISGTIWLFWTRKSLMLSIKKIFLWFTIPSVLVFSIYFWYGLIVSPSLFFQVFFTQSSRLSAGMINLINQISKPTFKNFFVDGWWLGAWFVSLISLKTLKDSKENLLLKISFAAMLLFILFTAAADYPWYYIPAIPFLAVFSGMFIAEIWEKPSIYSNFIFSLFFFSSSFHWGYFIFNKSEKIIFSIYRIILIFFLSSSFFQKRIKENKFLSIMWKILFLLLLHRIFLWNFRSITYFVANWP